MDRSISVAVVGGSDGHWSYWDEGRTDRAHSARHPSKLAAERAALLNGFEAVRDARPGEFPDGDVVDAAPGGR